MKALKTLLSCAVLCLVSAAQIQWVNGAAQADLFSGDPVNVTLPVTAGNTLLVTAKQYGNATAPTVTDTAGNTFVLVKSLTGQTSAGGNNNMFLYIATNVLGNATDKIQFSNSYACIVVDQFKGLTGTVDGSGTAAGGTDVYPNSTTLASSAFSTTYGNDLIYSVMSVDQNAGYIGSAASPLTLLTAPSAGSSATQNYQIGSADYLPGVILTNFSVSMTGIAPSSQTGNMDWALIVVAIKGAPAAHNACGFSSLGEGAC